MPLNYTRSRYDDPYFDDPDAPPPDLDPNPPSTPPVTELPNAPPTQPGVPPAPVPVGTPPPPPAPPPPDPTETPTWGGNAGATPYTAATDRTTWDTDSYNAPEYTAARYNPVAGSGWDAEKWNSPTHQTPKYVVGRILSGYDLNNPTQLRAAISDIQKAYPGTTWNGRDIITMPDGGVVDIIRDFGGESGISWQPLTGPGGAPLPQEPGAGGPSPSQSLVPVGTANPTAATGGGLTTTSTTAPGGSLSSSGLMSSIQATSGQPIDAEMDAARRAAILELLGRNPPTREEMLNSPENQAYLLQSQRAAERQRAELAERAAAEGFTDSGYFETELGGINQQRAEGEAGFLGQVAISRMEAYREDLQFAIAQAQQSGQFDLATQLQRQQMLLDAAIRREQVDLDRIQFNSRLGYDYAALQLEANRDAAEFGVNYQ